MSALIEDLEALREEQENVEDEAGEDVVTPIQYDISSYGVDYDVEGLVKRLDRNDVLIPQFQRNFVWTQQEASRFIESLLLGLPVPGVFMAKERDSNRLLVIDGQQRLKTLQFYYSGYFNPHEDDENRKVFKLIKVHPTFEGLTIDGLEPEDRVRLNDSIIHATVIKQESPANDDTSIYHVFDRLNSYGRRLTPQEIRTSLDHGPFIDLIKGLNEHAAWRRVYGKKNARLKDQELILRFLALYFDAPHYVAPMNEFLNRFSSTHRRADQDFLSRCKAIFTSTIDIVWDSLGEKAFRPVRAINAAVFDSVTVGLARRLADGPIADQKHVRTTYDDLLRDAQYLELVSRATANERNLEMRLKLATEKFARV